MHRTIGTWLEREVAGCPLEDARHGSVLLSGGPASDPWDQLFYDQLNFRFIEDAEGRLRTLAGYFSLAILMVRM